MFVWCKEIRIQLSSPTLFVCIWRKEKPNAYERISYKCKSAEFLHTLQNGLHLISFFMIFSVIYVKCVYNAYSSLSYLINNTSSTLVWRLNSQITENVSLSLTNPAVSITHRSYRTRTKHNRNVRRKWRLTTVFKYVSSRFRVCL